MPHAPHIYSLLEDALTECFGYHNQLNSFLERVGLTKEAVAAARATAEARKGRWPSAPKRFVAQDVLAALHTNEPDDDRLVSAMVDAFCRGTFREATPAGTAAIAGLKEEREKDSKAAEAKRAELERQREEARRNADAQLAKAQAERERFRARFVALATEPNAQQRGYKLETFLNDFLEYEGLTPRGSFRIIGEQIDGSFSASAKTWLLEAKWVADPVAGAEFGAFSWKVEGKTADTRGVFISINGFSKQAITALNGKGALRFVCVDGAHLLRSVEPGWTFERMLNIVWRHASETGEAYLPVGSARFQHWAERL